MDELQRLQPTQHFFLIGPELSAIYLLIRPVPLLQEIRHIGVRVANREVAVV